MCGRALRADAEAMAQASAKAIVVAQADTRRRCAQGSNVNR